MVSDNDMIMKESRSELGREQLDIFQSFLLPSLKFGAVSGELNFSSLHAFDFCFL